MPPLPLDRARADRAVAVFDNLRLPDVIGLPLIGESVGDWFRNIVRALFGGFDPDGTRRVTDLFIEVPKKNGKTTNAAAIMLTALLLNERPHALFVLFGPTQVISDHGFAAVAGMIRADQELDALLHVIDHTKTIRHRLTHAVLRITTFDMSTATGGKYAGWMLDEVHLLGSVPYASRVVAQLRGARVAIPESFGIMITTQSDQPPAGLFKEELKRARMVRNGEISGGGLLPILYEWPESVQIDPGQPWQNPRMWAQVNPAAGAAISLDGVVELAAQEKAKGEEAWRIFASQHLNIQIGGALHNDRWPGADYWARATLPALSLDDLLAASEVVTIGIDGGGEEDLLGLCVLGRTSEIVRHTWRATPDMPAREIETKRWIAWFHAWADPKVFERRKSIAAQLQDFITDGDLTVCDMSDGPFDFHDVADIIERVWQAGLLPEKFSIGVDKIGVPAMVDALTARGVTPECLSATPQGYKLNGVHKGTARKLRDGTLRVAPQPIAAWSAGNARTVMRGNAVSIEKAVSGTAKIDLLMALFGAFELMSLHPEASHMSYLETGGLVVV